MNNILLVSKTMLMTCIFLCSFISLAASTVEASFPIHSDDDFLLVDRLNNLSSIIDMRYTEEVRDRINNYVHEYPAGSQKILGRVSVYFPLIENKLREMNLPDDLKYLAVVESALRPDASSKSGAKGLWQFMKGTGKMYGLEINSTVDERKDPVKSTEAALNYLSDLHKQFGDWTVALAAYNCGPGNVRKAIRRSGGKRTYWEIRDFLPQETREYIPRHTAATYLMRYYYMHDIEPINLDNKVTSTGTFKVYKKLKFSDLADETGVSIEDLRFLNPSYLKSYIPANDGKNLLTLPTLEMHEYLSRHDKYDDLLFRIEKSRYKEAFDKVAKQRVKRIHKVINAIEPSQYEIEYERDLVAIGTLKVFPNIEDLRPKLYDYSDQKRMAYIQK